MAAARAVTFLVVAAAALAGAGSLPAQAGATDGRSAVSRAGSLLELAVTEYGAAVDGGRVVNRMEYDETLAFLGQARELYAGVLEETAAPPEGSRDLLPRFDSLRTLAEARGPAGAFSGRTRELLAEMERLWGVAPVDLPTRRPSAAAGARLYRLGCAACHGSGGRGDGPAAPGMEPPPADLAASFRRVEATPARDYQVISYGVPRTAMPESRDWLTVDQRWDLVAYLQTLRFGGSEVAEGKALALGRAPAAGPSAGGGSGDVPGRPLGAAVAPGRIGSPAAGESALAGRLRGWSDPERMLRVTDAELAAEVRGAREAAGRAPLSDQEVRSVVAYARFLLGTPRDGVPKADRSVQVTARLGAVDSLVAAAVAAAREGDAATSRSLAIQGYMEFERLEAELRARAPQLAREAEQAFADLRGASDGQGVDAAAASLRSTLGTVQEELTATQSGWALAGQSFFIILREGFEAILIIGAIIAFLVKTGHEERRRDVYAGAGVALLASALTAVAIETAFALSPADQEILEAVTMLLATAVLFSVSYWLLSKLEHERWERYLRTKMNEALGAGSALALAGVAFLAVYREGFETVLFYKALVISGGGRLGPIAGGFAVGSVALVGLYLALTRLGVRVPMRPFFGLTSGVLYAMAVSFAGKGIHELQAAGALDVTTLPGLPTVPLLGLYPTLETLTVQAALLVLLGVGLWFTFARPGSTAEPARA